MSGKSEPQSGRSGDAVPAIERRDTRIALAECLSRLSEPDQTLVVLRHGEGLTYRQIREVLGLRAAFSTLQRRLTIEPRMTVVHEMNCREKTSPEKLLCRFQCY